jgi:hypothetical protein
MTEPERALLDLEEYSRRAQQDPCFICKIVDGSEEVPHHVIYRLTQDHRPTPTRRAERFTSQKTQRLLRASPARCRRIRARAGQTAKTSE